MIYALHSTPTSTSCRMDTTKTSSSEFLHPISTPGACPLGASDGQNKRISPLLVTISTYCCPARTIHGASVALSRRCFHQLFGGVGRFRVPQCAQRGGSRGRRTQRVSRILSPLSSKNVELSVSIGLARSRGRGTYHHAVVPSKNG
jgi:hypothetical protein